MCRIDSIEALVHLDADQGRHQGPAGGLCFLYQLPDAGFGKLVIHKEGFNPLFAKGELHVAPEGNGSLPQVIVHRDKDMGEGLPAARPEGDQALLILHQGD